MSNFDEDDRKPDAYLEALKAEGAELLIRRPLDDAHVLARLCLIDAKIQQLTSPITIESWQEPKCS